MADNTALVCADCGSMFTRSSRKGVTPSRCETCKREAAKQAKLRYLAKQDPARGRDGVCLGCGSALPFRPGKGLQPTRCRECKLAASRESQQRVRRAQQAVAPPRVVTCVDCADTFEKVGTRGTAPLRCPECNRTCAVQRLRDRRAAARRAKAGNPDPQPTAQCVECGEPFPRPATRGRAPKRCGPCAALWVVEKARAYREREWAKLGGRPDRTCVDCDDVIPRDRKRSSPRCDSCRRMYLRDVWGAHSQQRRAAKLALPSERIVPREVFERDDWTCQMCGRVIDPEVKHPDPHSASLDHIVPLALDGHHTWDNVQTACLICNIRAGVHVRRRRTG